MMEQKVDRMEAEVTKRLLKREDTAREYKRCKFVGMSIMILLYHHMWSSLCWVQSDGTEA